jgi:hypothetical protein
MKAAVPKIREYFEPVLGTRPWKAKLGVGSFLTLDFGRRAKDHGHIHGEWHLWIYLSNWTLFHGDRRLADSDSDRHVISVAIKRLEQVSLSEIDFDQEHLKTTFVFGDFRLAVSPADYLDDADERDNYWLLFTPSKEVLRVGPSGIQVERAETPHYA